MSELAFGSDMESDSGRSSVDVPCGASDGGTSASSSMKADGCVEGEQLAMRVESLQQENRVLRMEMETMRYRCKGLEQENKDLKRARVNIVRDSAQPQYSFVQLIYCLMMLFPLTSVQIGG